MACALALARSNPGDVWRAADAGGVCGGRAGRQGPVSPRSPGGLAKGERPRAECLWGVVSGVVTAFGVSTFCGFGLGRRGATAERAGLRTRLRGLTEFRSRGRRVCGEFRSGRCRRISAGLTLVHSFKWTLGYPRIPSFSLSAPRPVSAARRRGYPMHSAATRCSTRDSYSTTSTYRYQPGYQVSGEW